jgi:hypothetical protein
MSTAAHKVAILERRLSHLSSEPRQLANAMAQREAEALRWALPLLRPLADAEAKRPRLSEPCSACNTAAGFLCAHLPRRT